MLLLVIFNIHILYFRNDFAAAWMNLGIVLANTGRYEESYSAYKTALRYRKKYPDCYYNLGNLVIRIFHNNRDNFISSCKATNSNTLIFCFILLVSRNEQNQ